MGRKKSDEKNEISVFKVAKGFKEQQEAEKKLAEQRMAERIAQKEKEKQEAYEKQLRDEKIELIRLKQGEIEQSEILSESKEEKVKLPFFKRISNFFYHNKWWLGIGVFFVALGGYLIYDLVTKTDPDVVILYIDNNAEIAYSEKFTDYLQNLCGDINDDGKAVASVYYIPYTGVEYTDYNNGSTTKLIAEMQNADAMLVISGKMADDAISPDITLVDLETLYPDNPQVKKYGFYLKDTSFAEEIGYSGEIDDELFLGIRAVAPVQWADEEEMQESYDKAIVILDMLIKDLS